LDQKIFKKFSDSARKILTHSQRIAKDMHSALCSEHLLIALASIPGTLAYEILHQTKNMINADQVRLILNLRGPETNLSSGISLPAKQVLEQSAKIAAEFNHTQIDPEHILLGITLTPNCLACQIILRVGVNPKDIRNQILGIFEGLGIIDKISQRLGFGGLEPMAVSPITASATKTAQPVKLPALSHFAKNLTLEASQGKLDPVMGRRPEIQRIVQTLARKTKNNPVLIGDPGVGKTAIVEGLALQIVNQETAPFLNNRQIYALDMALLVAGTTYRGQFEQRLKKVISEAKANQNVILFIDEFHTMIGAGSAEGSMDAANILKPALSRGDIRLIGATTVDEYRRQIEKDAALERRLQPVLIKEPSINQTIEILKGLKSNYEKHHKVEITDQALVAAATLSSRYISDRFLPDKAIDLIDEASAKAQISQTLPRENRKIVRKQKLLEEILAQKNQAIDSRNFEEAARLRAQELRLLDEIKTDQQIKLLKKKPSISEDDIAQIVASWTGIPVGNLLESEKAKLKNLNKELQRYVVGQDEAIQAISQVVRKSKTGIHNPLRPLGSFIFLGPTGVGKSHLAKTLAAKIYGQESALVKIDMSEFMERHNVSKLIGAPPGYVGYEESGKLTEAVRRQPYSVVLLDEIEKAHPETLNILLQVLEDGYLTDSKGRRVNFRNTIIIMTSNIGIDKLNKQAAIGFNSQTSLTQSQRWKDAKQNILDELTDILRPEFLNRVDRVLVFNPLDRRAILKIAEREVGELQARLAKEKIYLNVTASGLNLLAKLGFDPQFGARPLKRQIAQRIEDPLTSKILNGEVKKNQSVTISARNKRLVFRISKDTKVQTASLRRQSPRHGGRRRKCQIKS
jgi:ATP-dependent Clp protease ATP-binding subunit ClpC